ncbi:hypothetical protein DPMN_105326 [Dreissena polymorpha]|uniref:DOMON domain-containing protein n=1 Tax=Dreissena polymorpha TaxID=45954 RepID=A0A9D4HD51_DREPO|nr:hypothetical protein DPMN_105326 [Dreissena polymorpha]
MATTAVVSRPHDWRKVEDTTTKYVTTEQLTTATTVTEKTTTTDWRFTKDFTNAGQGGVTIIGTGGDGSSSTNFTWTGNNMTGNNPDGNSGSGKWTTRHHWCPSGDCSRANVTWYYNDNNVTFEVFFKGIKDYWSNWIALGISDDEKMVNTDVILLRTDDHYHFVALDSYIGGQRAPPKIDESQDVNLTSASLENDVLKFLVVRPLVTGDINDKQIGEKTYFLFLADGHRIGNTLLRHRNRYISPEVCLSPSCEKALGLGKINAQGAWEFSDDWNLIGPSSGRRRREAGAMAEGGAAEGETEAEGEGVGEGEGEPGDSCGALFAGNSPTTGDTIHPMDCTDMVIGSAKGPLSRIGDYYSRDRSTPLSDEALGGSNSLTAAIGEENGGWTTILFRRKLSAGSDAADHSFERGPMHVVWARGQEPGSIHHVPASGLEHNQSAASIPNYYKEDELKYHGRDLDGTSYGHRGYLTLDFFSQPTGNGGTGGVDTGGVWTGTGSTGSGESYSHPSGRYIVTWQRDNANNDMMYTISARLSDTERQWMAIGFNSQDRMASNT